MVIEVQVAADPRIDSARTRQPHQAHHQVVRHALFTEVHAVDQVVLQFMGQRRKKSIQQQACPPGHVPRHVQRRRTDHPGQGEGQNARAKGILMIEQRVALA
ncbi:hypothetical protein D3C84_266520 [compost metagenome]